MSYRKKSAPKKRRNRGKSKSTTKRRRRSMSGVSVKRGRVTRLLGTAAGAIAGPFLKKLPFVKDQGSLVQNLIVTGVGVVAPMLPIKFLKGDFVSSVADGVAISGVVGLVGDTGMLNGLPIVSGWRDMSTINGVGDAREDKQPAVNKAYEKVAEPGFQPTVVQMMNSYYSRTADGY